MDFHFGSFEPSVTKNDSVAELGNEILYFFPLQASSAFRFELKGVFLIGTSVKKAVPTVHTVQIEVFASPILYKQTPRATTIETK